MNPRDDFKYIAFYRQNPTYRYFTNDTHSMVGFFLDTLRLVEKEADPVVAQTILEELLSINQEMLDFLYTRERMLAANQIKTTASLIEFYQTELPKSWTGKEMRVNTFDIREDETELLPQARVQSLVTQLESCLDYKTNDLYVKKQNLAAATQAVMATIYNADTKFQFNNQERIDLLKKLIYRVNEIPHDKREKPIDLQRQIDDLLVDLLAELHQSKAKPNVLSMFATATPLVTNGDAGKDTKHQNSALAPKK